MKSRIAVVLFILSPSECILDFNADGIEPLLQREDSLKDRYFIACTGEPDMPKAAAARVYASVATTTASPQRSEGHPLVPIALFSGIGLLVSLVAILMGVQGAWY